MRVRIHRGAAEIGGNCIELGAAGSSILLDLGRPLWAEPGQHIPLPAAIGIGEPGPRPLALVLSHGHQDHWGLVPDLPHGIPIWIGRGAADVLRAAEFWGTGIDLRETGHLHHRIPFTIGPFTITPYLADHSGFDAYSLLVEAEGSRLFYTGDLRGHGRKHRAFDWLLDDPPPAVDVLLLEGTNLRAGPDRPDPGGALGAGPETALSVHPVGVANPGAVNSGGAATDAAATEADVEADLAATLKITPGLVVVLASAQNVDRLVTVYRAAVRTGRRVAVDLYTAEVAAATGRDTIPHLGEEWPRVSTYLPLRQRLRVKQSRQFHRTQAVRPHRIFDEDLASDPGGWVLFGTYQGQVPHLQRQALLTGGAVVWSLWDGYLTDDRNQQFVTSLAEARIPLIHHHTSGHASPSDLKRLVDALNPGCVVPIHTETPERYAEFFGRHARAHSDGEWWSACEPGPEAEPVPQCAHPRELPRRKRPTLDRSYDSFTSVGGDHDIDQR